MFPSEYCEILRNIFIEHLYGLFMFIAPEAKPGSSQASAIESFVIIVNDQKPLTVVANSPCCMVAGSLPGLCTQLFFGLLVCGILYEI